MSYGKAIAWLYCRRACNRTLITSMSIHVQQPVQQYCYSVPYIPGVYYALVHTWRVQQREIYANLLLYNSNAYCGYRTPHPVPTPMFHTCVYTFLFVFSRQY